MALRISYFAIAGFWCWNGSAQFWKTPKPIMGLKLWRELLHEAVKNELNCTKFNFEYAAQGYRYKKLKFFKQILKWW